MNLDTIISLANNSGGTLYGMAILLLVALTVIIERTRHLLHMQNAGVEIMNLLKTDAPLSSKSTQDKLIEHREMPHARLIQALSQESSGASSETIASHLEEAVMHEVPLLDRSLWMLDTVITLAPLLGLFGTILGMFKPGMKLELEASTFIKDRRIQGSSMGSNQFRVDIPDLLQFYKQGRLDLDLLITDHIRLDQINEAYEKLYAGSPVRQMIVLNG